MFLFGVELEVGMYIEELNDAEELGRREGARDEENLSIGEKGVGGRAEEGVGGAVVYGSKRLLVGAGARVLFYPTLLYNVVRNKFQAEFRWWDQIDEVLLYFLHSI